MFQIILGLIALVVAFACLNLIVEKFPRSCFFLYRFSGSMAITSAALQMWKMENATGKSPGMIFLFLAGFFYLVWLVKVIAYVMNSESERWWMVLLKIWLGLVALVVFPIGILSAMCHDWFSVRKVQDRAT